MSQVNEPDYLIGDSQMHVPKNDGGVIAWSDPKIKFVADICKGKKVLDLGCVQHDAEFSESSTWLHKAVCNVAAETVGLDLLKSGVDALNSKGYKVVHGDAQSFDMNEKYEVVVAGDLIEHLHDFEGFLKSCNKALQDNGRLIICTANPWHWHKVIKAFLGPVPVNTEHTCWLCPVTLEQLAMRFGFTIESVEYGSSRFKDKVLPAPKRIRHANWYSVLRRTNS